MDKNLNRPKVTLIAAMSIDGFIAPADKEKLPSTTWTSKEDWRFFTKQSKAIGTMILGSKTFETIKRPLPERQMIVMTSQPERYAQFDDSSLVFSSAKPEVILADLAAKGIEQVALCGGAHIYALFMQLDLVDELLLTVEPYVFGEGIKLFAGQIEQKFTLVSQEKLNENGTLVLSYQKIAKT
jgi:dihydrofolate reductase